jgi:hypothetical protein
MTDQGGTRHNLGAGGTRGKYRLFRNWSILTLFAELYGKITTMKFLLIVGGCISALASLWAAIAVCGMWFIVPLDHSMTAAHDILIRLAYTVLFVAASAVLGVCSLWAFRKTGTLHE